MALSIRNPSGVPAVEVLLTQAGPDVVILSIARGTSEESLLEVHQERDGKIKIHRYGNRDTTFPIFTDADGAIRIGETLF